MRAARAVKRALDLALAAVLLSALAPLLALLALAVRLSSPGPVLHRRRVLGLGGREFDAFKFRTMVEDADRRLRADPGLRAAWERHGKLRDDPRVTRVGAVLRRASLDELPQLVNVLRGEMSLVGPRILTREEGERYGAALARRQSVRPGITGLWQVSGRQNLGYARRIELDLEYVEAWSLGLDLKILARTLPAVVGMRGAS